MRLFPIADDQSPPDFAEVFPIIGLPDVQGGTISFPAPGKKPEPFHQFVRRGDLSR